MSRKSRHKKPRPKSRFDLDEADKLQIDNPLIHKCLSVVKAEAEEMALAVDSEHPPKELFKIAAEVARDPPNYTKVKMSRAQRDALKNEKKLGIFKQSKAFNVTMVLLCLSALTQGWIESTSNAANLTWPDHFGLLNSSGELDKSGKWIFAATSTAPFLTGTISALLFVDSRHLMGRRGVILISGILCFIGAIVAAAASSWVTLFVGRAVLGIGMGMKASVTAVFAAEISPSHIRGRIVMSWQLFVALGVACGFLSAVIVTYAGREEESWRWQTATLLIPLTAMLSLSWVVSESPRYHIKKGNLAEAFKVLCALRENHLLAARDLVYINAQIQVEIALLPRIADDIEPARPQLPPQSPQQGGSQMQQAQAGRDLLMLQERIRNLSYWTRLKQLIVDRRTSRATISAVVVMLSQQLCGINSVMFYSSNFLQFESGYGPAVGAAPAPGDFPGKTSYWLNFGIGAVNFLATFPAYFLIDRKGRRWLLLVMAPFMTLCMLAASLSFREPDTHTHIRSILAVSWIFGFVLFYSMGQGPVAFTYASEVFPLVYREVGFGVCVSANFFGAALLGLLVPHVQLAGESSFARPENSADAQSILLGAFAILNFIAMILIWALVRETAGSVINAKEGKINSMSLEELNYIFGVRTMRHIRYQSNVILPWRFRKTRWMLFHLFTTRWEEPSDPECMWQWEQAQDSDSDDEKSTERDGGTVSHVEAGGFDSSSPTISSDSLPTHARSRPGLRQRISSGSGSSSRRQRRQLSGRGGYQTTSDTS